MRANRGQPSELTCHSCRRSLGVTRYVIVGYLGRYSECEWCFEGVERPAEPELITDTFNMPESPHAVSLDAIFDKMLVPENR